ncbi:hypothetical protein GT020_11925 [Glutamicibacter soli]|uniref:Lipoprotein n=1 Tax=Glutamicibacter soli TaxID=453836 RepID=A0A6L9G681_9MICC|nr:hypothetical protein [Glutamicibacter soli]NAZ16764.1 hypothetical protein [Glutamicibacter soli]
MPSKLTKTKSFLAITSATLLLSACASGSSTNETASQDSQTQSSSAAPTSASAEAKAQSSIEPLAFNDSPLLGGPAKPKFDEGNPGEVGVVKVGPLLKEQGTLLFAFRNNTGEAISHVDWSATARSEGSLVGSGTSQGTTPSQIQPGEVGLAYIYFENAEDFPKGTDYEFKAKTPPADTSFYNTAPFAINEVNFIGESIVGSATNRTGAAATGPYRVSFYCFDDGKMAHQSTDYAAESDQDVADGESVSFSTKIYGHECSEYVVGVSGYFS